MKKSSKFNALVHGLYANDILLPWESPEDFEELFQQLKDEFRPTGRAEVETVLDIALTHWKKRNITRLFVLQIRKNPFTKEIVDSGKKSWGGVRNYVRAQAEMEGSLRAVIDGVCAGLVHELGRENKKTLRATDEEARQRHAANVERISASLTQKMAPLRDAILQHEGAEKAFDRFYDPEELEKLMRLEAAFDARINKLLARLVALKEFKRTPAGGGVGGGLLPPVL